MRASCTGALAGMYRFGLQRGMGTRSALDRGTSQYRYESRRNKSCGIIGLPNVGKSTLFNALTRTQSAEAANYPFCTVEPNTALVSVLDPRLKSCGNIAGTKKMVYTQMHFTDVAGLVKGAHKGEGLGNQFLGNIREAQVLLHVLRCFDDVDVVHVDDSSNLNPVADLEVIETELMLADLETCEKRISTLKKKAQGGNVEAIALYDMFVKCVKYLQGSTYLAHVKWTPDEAEILDTMQLLTSKHLAYICNADEDSAAEGNRLTRQVEEFVAERNAKLGFEANKVIALSASLEAEAASFDTEEEQQEYLSMAGLDTTGLTTVITTCSSMLKQHYFYTVGKQETRAWLIKHGCTAHEAAGKIHTDIQRGFIKAETIDIDDFVSLEGYDACKKAGKVRLESREYIVKEGDVIDFKFSKSS